MRRLCTRASSRRLLVVVAAISVITLAASSPIYSATRGSHAAAADCSIAAASEAATAAQFDVDPRLGKTPINHVICGPFLGPGSQAMAAMVAVPTGCGVSVGWAVFRFAGGVWQLVMKQENGARLQAVGSDIRETQGYMRPGDAYCHPSRMRTRIWHWNGSRFTHTTWKYSNVSSKRTATKLFYFESPSHNIWCDSDEDSCALGRAEARRHAHNLRVSPLQRPGEVWRRPGAGLRPGQRTGGFSM